MAKKTMYSKRLDRDFELEVCEAKEGQIVGDDSDITIVRASALEDILYNELGGAVTWSWQSLRNGAIVVDICDDTGVHVVGVGDIDSKSLKSRIAKEFPVATAWSRAVSAAVVRYLGFEGRVYTDKSFEIQEEFDACPDRAVTTPFPSPKNPLEAATTTVTEEPVDYAESIESAESTEAEEAIEDFVCTRGIAKGMTLGEIIASEDEKKFSPKNREEGLTLGHSYLKYVYAHGYVSGDLYEAVGKILEKHKSKTKAAD